jgi:hypothetical protein
VKWFDNKKTTLVSDGWLAIIRDLNLVEVATNFKSLVVN